MSIETEIRALNRTARAVLMALETTGKQEIEQNQALVRLMDLRFRALEAFVVGTLCASTGGTPEETKQTFEAFDLGSEAIEPVKEPKQTVEALALASKVIRLVQKANGDIDDTGNVL